MAVSASLPLISASNIGLRHGQEVILSGVGITLQPAEIVTLIGPNGSGKTSFLKILLGLLPASEGSVTRDENLRIGYVPQKIMFSDAMPMTVEWYLNLNKRNHNDMREIIRETKLQPLLKRPVQALSGGETQRMLLARALLCSPQLLVLDEPVQGADVNGQAELYDLILRMRDRLGCAVLMVSHDLHLVMAATDRVLCLNHHICCQGHPSEIHLHPEFIRMFGPRVSESLAVYVHHHDHTHGPGGEIIDCDKAH